MQRPRNYGPRIPRNGVDVFPGDQRITCPTLLQDDSNRFRFPPRFASPRYPTTQFNRFNSILCPRVLGRQKNVTLKSGIYPATRKFTAATIALF
jgi:hypothetical protein